MFYAPETYAYKRIYNFSSFVSSRFSPKYLNITLHLCYQTQLVSNNPDIQILFCKNKIQDMKL